MCRSFHSSTIDFRSLSIEVTVVVDLVDESFSSGDIAISTSDTSVDESTVCIVDVDDTVDTVVGGGNVGDDGINDCCVDSQTVEFLSCCGEVTDACSCSCLMGTSTNVSTIFGVVVLVDVVDMFLFLPILLLLVLLLLVLVLLFQWSSFISR